MIVMTERYVEPSADGIRYKVITVGAAVSLAMNAVKRRRLAADRVVQG